MKRMMVPLGRFVAARDPKSKTNFAPECFTVTAYDPVMGQYIAMGHSAPINLVGKSICHAEGRIPAEGEGEEVTDIVVVPAETVGIITRQAAVGVSGPFFGDPGAAMLTDAPKVGKAWLMTDLLPDGGMEVTITSVSATGTFTFKGEAGKRCVKGMSGSPIVQDGCLVGVLWGQSKQYEGRAVEAMADRLLDAWAEEPEQVTQKRTKRVPEKAMRKALDKANNEMAELQAQAVEKKFGPEVAERVRKAVKEAGIAAGTAVIKDLREKGIVQGGNHT